MKLEDEKKLVAEKLMGWDIHDNSYRHIDYEYHYHKTKPHTTQNRVFPKNWNPQSNDCPFSVWDEIWDKLGYNQEFTYSDNLWKLLECDILEPSGHNNMLFHTAKPEVCWKALIKTLEQS